MIDALVFTITSYGYRLYTHNLWLQLRRVGRDLLVLCVDTEGDAYFNSVGIPSRLFRPVGTGANQRRPAIFGSPDFKRFNALKLAALAELSVEAELLIFLDSDIGIFADPVPALSALDAPLLFQCDEGHAGPCADPCPNACTGVIAIRNRHVDAQNLFRMEPRTWLHAITDQDYVNDRMHHLGITFRTLPRDKFPNGVCPLDPATAVLYHFNFCIGNEKVARMRAAGLWFVDC
jgi:hypothetical protein